MPTKEERNAYHAEWERNIAKNVQKHSQYWYETARKSMENLYSEKSISFRDSLKAQIIGDQEFAAHKAACARAYMGIE